MRVLVCVKRVPAPGAKINITADGQAVDTAQLTSLGCDPTRKDTVAVKSNHHFRAAFQPISRAFFGSSTLNDVPCRL